MKKRIAHLVLIMNIFAVVTLSGCTAVDNIKVKLGMKNTDFEYIQQNKIEKIVIQSTRDTGFRFVVTDQDTIRDLYDILSSADEAEEKSSLEPDYIFEMFENDDTVHKFNYVTGLEKGDVGNLYNDEKKYIVSKRIDNDILSNLWTLRKPREFQTVYYGAIMDVLKSYKYEIDMTKKVGIMINDDVEVAKYILSIDLEKFKKDLSKINENIQIIDGNEDDFDVIVTVKTLGYKTNRYRSSVKVYDKDTNEEKKYYTGCTHDNAKWTIEVDTEAFEP